VPSKALKGSTPNILEYAQFGWFEYVWYLDPTVQLPEDAKKLGRWIGVAHDVGSPMTFWILPALCKVIVRSFVTALLDDKKADPVVQQ
jgi:hypothetical protein